MANSLQVDVDVLNYICFLAPFNDRNTEEKKCQERFHNDKSD